MSASHRDCQHVRDVGQLHQHVHDARGGADVWRPGGGDSSDQQDAAVVGHACDISGSAVGDRRKLVADGRRAEAGDPQAPGHAHQFGFAHPWGWSDSEWESRLFWGAGVQAVSVAELCGSVRADRHGQLRTAAAPGRHWRSSANRHCCLRQDTQASVRRLSRLERSGPARQDLHPFSGRRFSVEWHARASARAAADAGRFTRLERLLCPAKGPQGLRRPGQRAQELGHGQLPAPQGTVASPGGHWSAFCAVADWWGVYVCTAAGARLRVLCAAAARAVADSACTAVGAAPGACTVTDVASAD
jgi:hypothetical protein